jgi:hypothetical protein
MHRRPGDYVSIPPAEVHSRQYASAIAEPGGFDVVVKPFSGSHHRSSELFPACSGSFHRIDGSLSIEADHVEAQTGSQGDVR